MNIIIHTITYIYIQKYINEYIRKYNFWVHDNVNNHFTILAYRLPQRLPKGGFFSESPMCFSNLQISKKNYSKSLSWTWNLNFPPITVNNKFKFQAQDSNLEYFYFGDLEIWKTNRTLWKKVTFSIYVWKGVFSSVSAALYYCLLSERK